MPETIDTPSVLDKLTQRSGQLYTLPAVAMEVIELTNNAKVDVARLKECIENDPALTGKILQTVNSSLFGMSREVTDLNQALALLGIKPLKLLVLGFSLPKNLFEGVEAEVLAQYWRHTLTKAVAARELAETVWEQSGDEPFVAGLLQDLGVLVLLQDLGGTYSDFLNKVSETSADLPRLELETLGFDHTILSARLLESWGLPDSLVRAVGMVNNIGRVQTLEQPQRDLSQILHLAELLSQILADGRPEVLSELHTAVDAYHPDARERLEAIVARLEDRVNSLAEVLSLSLPEGKGFLDILADAHARLADVAADVAGSLVGSEKTALWQETPWQETESLLGAVSSFHKGETWASGEQLAKLATAELVARPVSPGGAVSPGETAEDALIDPGLIGRVAGAINSCRQARRPLSLLFVEVDHYDEVILSRGPDGAAAIVNLLQAATSQMTDSPHGSYSVDTARTALLLEGEDRQQAVETGHRLVRGLRNWSQLRVAAGEAPVTVSVGVATVAMPPRNFPPEQLIEAAERCLNGARCTGGDCQKSIEIN